MTLARGEKIKISKKYVFEKKKKITKKPRKQSCFSFLFFELKKTDKPVKVHLYHFILENLQC